MTQPETTTEATDVESPKDEQTPLQRFVHPYFERDGVTIYHGDCHEILPHLSGDVIVTDPPYGADRCGWDDAKEQVDLRRWAEQWTAAAPLVFFTFRAGWVWRLGEIVGDAAEIFRVIVWSKPFVPTCRMANFKWHWEPVVMMGRAGSKPPWKPWVKPDIVEVMPVWSRQHPENVGHNSQKPLGLLRYLLEPSTDEGQTVIDPFMGSGSTLVAARDMGLRAIGIEREERFCEMAAKRLAQRVLPFVG